MYMYSMYDQLTRRIKLIPCAGCGFISDRKICVVPECVYMYVMYEAVIYRTNLLCCYSLKPA